MSLRHTFSCIALLTSLGCSSSDTATSGGACAPGESFSCACIDGSPGTQMCTDDGRSLTACTCSGGAPTAGFGQSGTPLPGAPGEPPSVPGSTGTDPANPVGPTPVTPDPTTPDPTTAEPTTPPAPPAVDQGTGIVVADVACGAVLDAAALPPFTQIGGRQVFIDYPCNKAPGTPATFILNLHGTMGLEAGKIYQRGYLPAYQYIDTHDFIIATPKSVVSQWGNGDGGADEPHLLETVEYVYSTFSEFDIQSMWVLGHSWGSMYSQGFACHPALSGRADGVILMSGGAGLPACANELSVIATVGELDIVAGQPDQTAVAAAHGCGGRTDFNLGANVVTDWGGCSPGWVHRNYFMLGKAHGFDPVDWPDQGMTQDIVDLIRDTR